ncbi:bifunctional lysylphosphatidylglycerol flippase/synthetase MprF [Demequina sp. NBRC 110056]|uniref:bifunctional lysylphosphatidylglycerol flippase/synthetase MprF n=1 Tax=Demequina sp. NBRC 110056 TaxID=1570345 RepID=UPI000A002BE2|nr:phosphatidylglycerol lysyltransferase domain-containing protein [Demequina sp. NBRC 110056]
MGNAPATPSVADDEASEPSLVARIWALVRSAPGTLALSALILVGGIVSGALWTPAEDSGLLDTWGWGLPAFEEGRWWTILGGVLISPTPWMYPLIIGLFVVGAGFLESRYGFLRMAAVTVGCHIVAVLTVAGILWSLQGTSLEWAQELGDVLDVGASNMAFGAIGAMTAALPLLWRRRVRLIGILYSIAMILWAGEIWDLTHAVAFAAGLAVGPWAVRRAYERPQLHWGGQETRDVAAIILAFSALQSLLARVWPGEGGLLSFGHPEVSDYTMLGEVGWAIIQLLLAFAIHRGSRFAWWFVVVGTGFVVLAGSAAILVGETSASFWVDYGLEVALFVVLLVGRKHFAVRGAKGARARIWRRIGIAAAAVMVGTTAAIMALGSSFDHQPTWSEALATSFSRILGDSDDGLQPETTAARVLLSVIGLLWYAIIAVSIAGLLLTSRRPENVAEARDRFIELQVERTGMSSIGYMARWPGITHWVSEDGEAAWGFKLVGNTAVVLGDPAGGTDAVAAHATEFAEHCRARGWREAYFAVSPGLREALAQQGLKAIQVAEDTVIHLPDLEFKGKAWQDVRSSLNRANREGVTMRAVQLAQAPRGLKDQLEAIEAQWAGDKSLPEMEFTLGGLDEAADPNVVMHIAVDEDGTVHGMTSWMPVYRDGDVVGWTIDIMKRRLDDGVMGGVMEFLIAQTALDFKEAGYEFISLSCAPLSYSGEVESSVERLLDILADRMEPYYGFTSLERFKAKFKPEHVPMYLLYRDEARLPAITVAILRAYLPDATATDLIRAAAHPGD